VCVARATVGDLFAKLSSYHMILMSLVPIVLYTVTFVSLYYKYVKACRENETSSSNINEIRRRLHDKITRSLLFMTLIHLFTFFTTSFSALFTNNLPYRGITIGPYFSTLYLTTGMSQLISNLIFVDRYRNRFVAMFHSTQIGAQNVEMH